MEKLCCTNLIQVYPICTVGFYKLLVLIFLFPSFQESGDDEYHGEHSDTEDEVDSDFDIDEGDEPDSDQEEDAPRRKSRVVTKAYKVFHSFQELSDCYSPAPEEKHVMVKKHAKKKKKKLSDLINNQSEKMRSTIGTTKNNLRKITK